mmetsp:Transcript_11796/g.13710  ORF Transcript_11796/g.13710 Transcript_11796/m.13710 type:complete len:150 (+) Transcript_11796:395-844(+)
MKFGKQLVKASGASTQLCNVSDWLDYKGLKKLLSSFPSSKDAEGNPCEKPNETIRTSVHEREFFTLLKKELEKVTKVFKQLKVSLLQQVTVLNLQQVRVLQLFHALQSSTPKKLELDRLLHMQLELNVKTHLDLILLESYAVLNYVGFR